MDLFVGNGGDVEYVDDGKRLVVRPARSALYRNDGGMRFADVSAASGADVERWVQSAATGDVDGDGDTELYLACFGADVLLCNDGGRFTDATAAAGLGNERWGTGAAFADVDQDGDLDLYVAAGGPRPRTSRASTPARRTSSTWATGSAASATRRPRRASRWRRRCAPTRRCSPTSTWTAIPTCSSRTTCSPRTCS
jgi:hypothetical protein